METECLICHKVFSKFVLHLGSCIPKQVRTGKTVKHVLIRVRSKEFGHFAYFLTWGGNTLNDLDDVLRSIWLTCCYAHQSGFFLKRDELSMDLKLRRLLPKSKLEYMYDFGSTTHLTVEILKFFEFDSGRENRFWLLGRNEPFEYICDTCNKRKAVQLSPYNQGEGFICQTCFKKNFSDDNDCADDCRPVVNSPRMGICVYTGSKNDTEFRWECG